jgi:hypothetical protein
MSDLTGLPYTAYRDPQNRNRLNDRINHGPLEGVEFSGSQVNSTRPELSPCLARLDPRDPRALAIIRQGQTTLAQQPREDQLGPATGPVLPVERERCARCRQQLPDEAAARTERDRRRVHRSDARSMSPGKNNIKARQCTRGQPLYTS